MECFPLEKPVSKPYSNFKTRGNKVLIKKKTRTLVNQNEQIT